MGKERQRETGRGEREETRGMRRVNVLVLALAALLAVASAHPPKYIDPADPAVVAAKSFLEADLNAKFNSTNHEVVHYVDAQRQVVNGFNYMLTVLVKTTTEETGKTDWVLHKARIYEHPAWDTSATEKYEVTVDEVPVFEEADLDLAAEVGAYVEQSLGASANDEGMKLSEVSSHLEQRVDVEYVSLTDGTTTEEAVSHRVSGSFASGEGSAVYDISFVTKGGEFLFFDSAIVSRRGDSGSDDGGVLPSPGGSDVKLLTARTSIFAIFLVGLVTCAILLVHFFRRRRKRSKEDWYIEQLTDIDEL